MKNVVIVVLAITLLLVGVSALIEKSENKKKEAAERQLQNDEYVYIDTNGCLHTDKKCIHLFDMYAVEMVRKDDKYLSLLYDYVCVDCYKPEHMKRQSKEAK